MVSPAELLAALATALALLFAWLLVRRGAPASPDPAGAFPKPAPRVEASGTSAPPSPGAQEPAAAPKSPEQPLAVLAEPAVPAEAEEQAAEAKQGEEQEQDGEEDPPPAEPEEDDGEAFSFKYSPGKLRGNQYRKMMTKEELEEEQRIELTSDLTAL